MEPIDSAEFIRSRCFVRTWRGLSRPRNECRRCSAGGQGC